MATNNSVNQKTTGLQSLTSAGVFNGRTITGTANQVAVSNGDGISGNPTLSLPANVLNSSQSLFQAYVTTSLTNKTGDGTAYTIIFDTVGLNQGSNYTSGTGTFTAPVTGRYLFTCTVSVTNLAAGHTSGFVNLVVSGTSAATFQCGLINPNACKELVFNICTLPPASFIVAMTAGDTAVCSVKVSGSTKTVSIFGAGASSFCGMLLPA